MSTAEHRASLTRQSYVAADGDGSPILRLGVRRLRRADQVELERLLLALDQSSRLCRFNRSASDRCLIDHASSALADATWIGGAFLEERLRGVVEVYDYGALGFAEAAFAVDADWRRRGIGSALLRAAMAWAGQSGVPKLRMVFSRTNLPMRKLAGKADARLDLAFDEMTAEIALG